MKQNKQPRDTTDTYKSNQNEDNAQKNREIEKKMKTNLFERQKYEKHGKRSVLN